MKTELNLLAAGIFLAALSTGLGQTTLQFSTNVNYVAENAGSVILTVQRTGDTNTEVTVDFASNNGSAIAGSDYTATNGTLTLLAGETNQIITVALLNDGVVETASYESFTVTLSNPTNAILGTRTIANVRITDNDKGLALEFANYWAREDEGSVLIGVVRNDDGNFPVSVDFATSNLTATNGGDYAATNGTLLFAAGEKLKLFTVPIINDGLKESSETFRVTLSNPTNQVLGTQKIATITLTDNDPGVQFTRNENWVHENEGTIRLTVTRGNDGLLGAFTVDYATTNLTAVAGQDYAETHGTLEFAAGEMTKSITVPVFDEGVAETDEVFRVGLSNPTGGMALGAAASVTATVTVCDTTEMRSHRFDNIRVSPEGVVSLTLGGGYTPGVGLSNRFQPYFDIYPIEVSTNLVDWMPFQWLVRTNSSTNPLDVVDTHSSPSSQRFYRTPMSPMVAPLPAPTGPYAVGRMDRFVTDPTRRNRNKISTNNSFGITIWYPAERQAGQRPSAYEQEPIIKAPDSWVGLQDRVPYFRSHSVQNAPVAINAGRCPVVFFSHGWTTYRQGGVDKMENLASHGYVTIAVDHFDCSFTVLPDGRWFSDDTDNSWRPKTAEGVQNRVQDFRSVLGQLEIWNQNDPLLAGCLDLEKLGAVGQSYGGEVAAEFCRIEPRCLAAINLDEFGFVMVPEPLPKPTLTMNHYQSGDINSDMTVFNNSTSPAYWLQISNTEHASFDGQYWYLNRGLSGQEASRTMNALALWYLNNYLKGSTDPMPTLADYPRVMNFKQK